MTTQQSDQVHENRIRSDIRAFLEYHILEELSLKAACEAAGLPYHKNVSQHKSSKAGKAYVAQLKRRRKVIVEFGVDEPSMATLMELRDTARKAGSFVAAVRAHELCVRVAANSDKKRTGNHKAVDVMTREEMIAELQEIKLKADGKGIEVEESPLVTELRESMGRT
jgi:hypothetical protein